MVAEFQFFLNTGLEHARFCKSRSAGAAETPVTIDVTATKVVKEIFMLAALNQKASPRMGRRRIIREIWCKAL